MKYELIVVEVLEGKEEEANKVCGQIADMLHKESNLGTIRDFSWRNYNTSKDFEAYLSGILEGLNIAKNSFAKEK